MNKKLKILFDKKQKNARQYIREWLGHRAASKAFAKGALNWNE